MEKFGKIERMRLLHRQNCGFVCFYSREAAEKAIITLHEKFFLCDKKIKLDWAKCQLQEQKAYRVKKGGKGSNTAAASKIQDPTEESKEVQVTKKNQPVMPQAAKVDALEDDPLQVRAGPCAELITEYSSVMPKKGVINQQ